MQEHRIAQELKLQGHGIPNLIDILAGGKEAIDNVEYHYVVMPFHKGTTLSSYIRQSEYDNDFIRKVLGTLTSVTEALLALGIAHRDVKSENIMIDDEGNLVLMDLGVLKLIATESISDDAHREFVGTLRYAPPEFITRKEADNLEGWRSITLYQIGGVLHDLVVKEELFKDSYPYPNLVVSILEDAPPVSNSLVDFELVQLTRDLLTKDWKKRLASCPVDRLMRLAVAGAKNLPSIDQYVEDIRKMSQGHRMKIEEAEQHRRTRYERNRNSGALSMRFQTLVNGCFEFGKGLGLYGHYEISKPTTDEVTEVNGTFTKAVSYIVTIQGKQAQGFLNHLMILVKVTCDEQSSGSISMLGIFPGAMFKYNEADPKKKFSALSKELLKVHQAVRKSNGSIEIRLDTIFEGTISLDDQFRDKIREQWLKLLKLALEKVADKVTLTLDRALRHQKGEIRTYVPVRVEEPIVIRPESHD